MKRHTHFTQVSKYILSRLAIIVVVTMSMSVGMTQATLDPILKERMIEAETHSVCIKVAVSDIIKTESHLDKIEKGITVYNQLTKREEVRSFLISPVIISTVSNTDIEALLSLNEVVAISHNETYMISSYLSVDNVVDTRDPEDPEWGIQQIEADSVWSLGYRGQDVVVAGQDTGYEWDNAALKTQYAGWDTDLQLVNHNYRWHDAIHEINHLHNDSIIDANTNPCGLSLNSPCDDHNHGTHTMGTMVGLDSLYQMGVAPEAQWIGCRNMDRGYGSLETYLDCFEWFLAPTRIDGTAPKPWLAPDVINNSWACPEMEADHCRLYIQDEAKCHSTRRQCTIMCQRWRIPSLEWYKYGRTTCSGSCCLNNNLIITPNPATNLITLEDYASTLLVTSTQGKLVGSYTYVNAVDVSGLPSGTYVLTAIDSKGQVQSGKFVKL